MNGDRVLKCMKILVPIVGIGIVLTVVTFAITIATLVKVNKGFDDIQVNGFETTLSTTTRPINPPNTTTNPTAQTTTTTIVTGTAATAITTPPSSNAILPQQIHIQDVINHLYALQQIADNANGNRAIHTTGFNQTLDYIVDTLTAKTNFIVNKTFFPVRTFHLSSDPTLGAWINNVTIDYNYSLDLSKSDFTVARYSTSANFSDYLELTIIPNGGCTGADWTKAEPPANGRVALVKRGDCTFVEKAQFATDYNAAAIFIYNHGNTENDMRPSNINLGQKNKIPALSLSHNVGLQLFYADQDPINNLTVRFSISIDNEVPAPVGNICADTPTGDPTRTIVIGSHSDSVPEGPGINDNGSGSAANLQLAIALAELFKTSTYEKYKYRVRFCWWGAEEVGLLGSRDHVDRAINATTVGERVTDYLINLNYDMLASPNYIFGIYDDKTVNNATPPLAIPGTKKVNELFSDWFTQQQLPWSETDFSGRSDYAPFLEQGIVAGGLFTGAEQNKTVIQRDYYDLLLGQGLGGLADVPYDSCYHKACDNIGNINLFAYAKMVQAAAYALEYLGQQDDLETWLYPEGRPARSFDEPPRRYYDSINEYFNIPYF